MAIDIGRIAFEAYQKFAEEQQGTIDKFFFRLVEWEELSQSDQNAWRYAAVAVTKHTDESREDVLSDPEVCA